MKKAELIIDKPQFNVDLYYATRFTAPDEVVYLKIGKKKYLMLTALELDRGKKEATVDSVIPVQPYVGKAARSKKKPIILDAVIAFLEEKKIRCVVVPNTMSFIYAEYLKKSGLKVEAGPNPFYIERFKKTRAEVGYILNAQKMVYKAMSLAEKMLKESAIKKGRLYLRGKPLTSEIVRNEIELFLFKNGYEITDGTIVAGGLDGTDPHCNGSGILKPHEAIVVDIFPRSVKTRFYGDATRTFCRGKAPERLKKMYNTVKEAQIDAIGKIKPGVNGKTIHEGVVKFFEGKGYKTGSSNGKTEGFFHATGHGIGLELHEEPLRIKPINYILKEGFITSVEPGLYYKEIGGVRIEDLVLVTKTGHRILGSYPKKLEIL